MARNSRLRQVAKKIRQRGILAGNGPLERFFWKRSAPAA
jgi:hypothetical protein